MLTW
jgi:endonuclease YncB( thermonuclease family)